jgi:glycosyltransferase involved in cell wall biosynthesis
MPWARQLGFLGREALAHLYANADLCVLPSTSETCGLVALEAMASGLPVIAADAGGLRESVVSRTTGLLVPPDDAGALAAGIVELALRRAYRQSLAEGARRMVLPRDSAREDRELLQQYQTLIRPPVSEAA